jgi:formamidopyrimidine-DNA glycosylase
MMPELPEVENVRISLLPFIQNQEIKDVVINMPKLVTSKGTTRNSDPKKALEFTLQTTGRKIVNLTRRAKNLVFHLSDGAVLIAHLKMTGQFVYVPFYHKTQSIIGGGHPIELSESRLPNKHTYIILTLEQGTLFYNDIRQFGYILYYPDYQSMLSDGHFSNYGLEPLESEFIQDDFVSKIKEKTGTLKSTLLSQQIVVGLGNIYVDECCFLAGIRPQNKIATIPKTKLKTLFSHIKSVLNKAVSEGGSSVANYILADGSRGNYARFHFVYNRKGKPCKLCGTPLKSIVNAGRTTVYCQHCQS